MHIGNQNNGTAVAGLTGTGISFGSALGTRTGGIKRVFWLKDCINKAFSKLLRTKDYGLFFSS